MNCKFEAILLYTGGSETVCQEYSEKFGWHIIAHKRKFINNFA